MLLKILAHIARARMLFAKANQDTRTASRERSKFYEQIWREAADAIGATVEACDDEILQITRGELRTNVFRNYTSLDDPVTLRLAGNKSIVQRVLQDEGSPTPRCAKFSIQTLSKALHFLDSQKICVVKPASGTGAGQGITTRVRTPRQLTQAAITATAFCSDLIAEEQIAGDNYRLLFLDGELIDAVRRKPPTVVGDGRSKVGDLVNQQNQRRLEAGFKLSQVLLRRDLDMKRTLSDQNLSWRSVPKEGQTVVLKTVINENMREDNETVVNEVAPAVIDSARQAADVLGVRLAGVDIITPDISRKLDDVGGVILEVNTTPGFHFHYYKKPEACRIAIPILEACLRNGSKTLTHYHATNVPEHPSYGKS